MSIGLGNIAFTNPEAVVSPLAPTGANEGLTVIGGNVQLGVPLSAPDPTKDITVPRETIIDDPAGYYEIRDAASNNRFRFNANEEAWTSSINVNPPNDRAKIRFAHDGIGINSTSGRVLNFGTSYPDGAYQGFLDCASDLILNSSIKETFQLQLSKTFLFGVTSTSYGMKLPYNPAYDGCEVNFTNNGGDQMLVGYNLAIPPFDGNLFKIQPYPGGVLTDYSFAVNTTEGVVNIGLTALTTSAVLNLKGDINKASLNIADTAAPSSPIPGDIWRVGNNLMYEDNVGTFSITKQSSAIPATRVPYADANGALTSSSNMSFYFGELHVDNVYCNGFVRGISRIIGGGTSSTDAFVICSGSTITRASFMIDAGVAPSSPVNGQIWFDGTDLFMRIGGVTKTFTIV